MEAKEGKRENIRIGDKTNNIRSSMQETLTRLEENEARMREVNLEVGARFLLWFQECMEELRRAVQHPEFRERRSMMKLEFILSQLEHHFTASASPRRLWNAFRYLKLYFRIYPFVKPKHSKKALEMIGRIEADQTSDAEEAGGDVRAWFGNRIWTVLRAIESPSFREPGRMMEIVFFLEALERFFVDRARSRDFANIFQYFKLYFWVYPLVRVRQSERAVHMVERIYQGMDYEFTYEAHVKPGVLEDRERMGSPAQDIRGSGLVPAAA